eukprot:m.28811 g.28811  ORF g.28811 m.28811 type:complete len:341 (+) comp11884_c0_seq1:3-1025(+)
MMDVLLLELQSHIGALRVFSSNTATSLDATESLTSIKLSCPNKTITLPEGLQLNPTSSAGVLDANSGTRLAVVGKLLAQQYEPPTPEQQPLWMACRSCRTVLSHPNLIAYPAPSDRWAEVADFVNCDEHHHVPTHVDACSGKALYNDMTVRCIMEDIAPCAIPSPDSSETTSMRCCRCQARLGTTTNGQATFERHCIATSLPRDDRELPRVGAKLQQVMIARGYQKFLLSSRDHRGQANVPFLAVWFPSSLPLLLWTSSSVSDEGWQPGLKCMYALHVGTTISEAGIQLGAEWHGNDLVDQLELPYTTLLELTKSLAVTSRWLPPAQRQLRDLTVGYWLL